MAGNTTKANLMQTAVNAAATLTAAFVNGGLVSSIEDARAAFATERDSIFNLLEEQPNEAPKGATSGGGSKGGGKKPSGYTKNDDGSYTFDSVEAALAVELKYGSFAGETIGKVLELSASDAAKYGYGEGDKTGRQYVEWLSGNEKGQFTMAAAKKVLA